MQFIMEIDLNLQATCYQLAWVSTREPPMLIVVFRLLLFLESIGLKNIPVCLARCCKAKYSLPV